MSTYKTKLETIKLLEQWASGDLTGLGNKNVGLCANLGDFGWLEPYFLSWDEFSGDPSLPVSHPQKNPVDAYLSEVAERGDGGLWRGEYGAARMRLCAHIAKEMKKELGN